MSPEWIKEDITMAISAETYIINALPKLAKTCGLQEFQKANIPIAEDYHPELDESLLLPPRQISVYKSLLGSANWIITLGRFDISYAVSSLARYTMAPREGHLSALQRVFGYLRNKPKGRILIDASQTEIANKAKL